MCVWVCVGRRIVKWMGSEKTSLKTEMDVNTAWHQGLGILSEN